MDLGDIIKDGCDSLSLVCSTFVHIGKNKRRLGALPDSFAR